MEPRQRRALAQLVFGSADGQEYLAALEAEAGMGETPWHADSSDRTAYNCGMQALILFIHKDLEANTTPGDGYERLI